MHTHVPDQRRQRGSVLAVFAVSLFAVLMFFGLALDGGLLYLTRATLSKATDSAALMGVRSMGQGDAAARQIAESTFAMNYLATSLPTRQVAFPQVNVTIDTDAFGNRRLTVDSNVVMNTFVIGMVPRFAQINVHAVAQGSRARLIMGVALDRSGSMLSNGGSAALPGAVDTFVNYFDETFDQLALASYADHATLDVSMRNSFKTPVRNRVQSMPFGGWTYSHGGIDVAQQQIASVPVNPNENVYKVLVFFTDGHANSFLNNINCTGSTFRSLVLVPGNDDDDFRNPANGSTVTCSASRTRNFLSLKTGGWRTRNTSNVTDEGLFMAERSAQLARLAGFAVFSIGLGNNINQNSLRKMANDPASASYNPAEPEGMAVFAPTAADLEDVFRQIAARILLRLTR
jgi:Flp pilus assembly protein TadG